MRHPALHPSRLLGSERKVLAYISIMLPESLSILATNPEI